MSKIAVVYWSGTGNTAAMAQAVSEGAQTGGAQVTTLTSAQFSADMMDQFDAVAFGCPSMGREVLEEREFQPMFNACLPKLRDKRIALFGSFGWGTGDWMFDWEGDCNCAGAKRVCTSVICCGYPDERAVAACRRLGAALV